MFVGGIDGMSRGCLLEVHAKKSHWISHEMYDYSKGMIDLSKSMKREDYLKMQEKENKFDFSDLCLKANKAVDDGLLKKFIRHENCIEFFGPYIEAFSKEREKEAHDYIQSLYQEEFVISGEDDKWRIKTNSKITLLNGITLACVGVTDYGVVFKEFEMAVSYIVLKGATVKQSKGDK